jgi:predicted secreted protein
MRTMLLAKGFWAVLGLCLISCLTIGGCKDDDGSSGAQTITEKGFGGSATLRVGELVTVALHENPSTGYSWRLKWEPRGALKLVDDSVIPPSSGRIGAGGVRRFVLRAERVGSATVTAQYGRWWQGGEREAPRGFSVNVVE